MSNSVKKENINYWIAPVSTNSYIESDTVFDKLLKKENIFALNNSSLYKTKIKKNDLICFYLKGKGIVANAKIITEPKKERNPYLNKHFGWVIHLKNLRLYLEKPIVLNVQLRDKLEAFKYNKPGNWGWFVLTLHSVSQNDFNYLVGKKEVKQGKNERG